MFQILLTIKWLRCYPTIHTLAMLFGVDVSAVHKIIHKFVRILHVYLVKKYIRWHSAQVVAIIDGTPFRISKPEDQYRNHVL